MEKERGIKIMIVGASSEAGEEMAEKIANLLSIPIENIHQREESDVDNNLHEPEYIFIGSNHIRSSSEGLLETLQNIGRASKEMILTIPEAPEETFSIADLAETLIKETSLAIEKLRLDVDDYYIKLLLKEDTTTSGGRVISVSGKIIPKHEKSEILNLSKNLKRARDDHVSKTTQFEEVLGGFFNTNYIDLIFILLCFPLSIFGIRIVRSPCFSVASALSGFTSAGNMTVLANEPQYNSRE